MSRNDSYTPPPSELEIEKFEEQKRQNKISNQFTLDQIQIQKISKKAAIVAAIAAIIAATSALYNAWDASNSRAIVEGFIKQNSIRTEIKK